MSIRFDLIAQQLLQKDFEQCTTEELEHFADAHPFLAPAQFLLVKKLQQQQDPAYKIKAQKAALYYYQPVAFEAFLLADEPVFKSALAMQPGTDTPAETVAIEAAVATPPVEEREEQAKEDAIFEAQAEKPETTTEPAAPVAISEEKNTTEIQPEEAQPLRPIPGLIQLSKEAPTDTFTFEPFHTVDYFASQGIKLSQEELPKDKFGKQLMSFTAWLKTMKKLPAAQQTKNMDPQAEATVEHMAADSVSNPEVITETMAEVWLKQGQPQKAAEVYRKLSLRYPSKKVYFAAKLQNLK